MPCRTVLGRSSLIQAQIDSEMSCFPFVLCNHMSLVYQLTSQIAAGTVDELRFAARGRAEVVDAGFVMNVAEGVDLWLDALLDVSREGF